MTTNSPPLVALSATYGAGGKLVGERVAQALAVPFLDQLWSPAELAAAARHAAAHALHTQNMRGDQAVDEQWTTRASAQLASTDVVRASDATVLKLDETGGVVVGRAGPYLLRGRALCVLLDRARWGGVVRAV